MRIGVSNCPCPSDGWTVEFGFGPVPGAVHFRLIVCDFVQLDQARYPMSVSENFGQSRFWNFFHTGSHHSMPVQQKMYIAPLFCFNSPCLFNPLYHFKLLLFFFTSSILCTTLSCFFTSSILCTTLSCCCFFLPLQSSVPL